MVIHVKPRPNAGRNYNAPPDALQQIQAWHRGTTWAGLISGPISEWSEADLYNIRTNRQGRW
jgi:hypothetical protein